MKQKEDIFKIIEKKAKGLEMTPRPMAWDKLEHKLDKQSSDTKVGIYRWLSVAASVVALFAIGLAVSVGQNTEDGPAANVLCLDCIEEEGRVINHFVAFERKNRALLMKSLEERVSDSDLVSAINKNVAPSQGLLAEANLKKEFKKSTETTLKYNDQDVEGENEFLEMENTQIAALEIPKAKNLPIPSKQITKPKPIEATKSKKIKEPVTVTEDIEYVAFDMADMDRPEMEEVVMPPVFAEKIEAPRSQVVTVPEPKAQEVLSGTAPASVDKATSPAFPSKDIEMPVAMDNMEMKEAPKNTRSTKSKAIASSKKEEMKSTRKTAAFSLENFTWLEGAWTGSYNQKEYKNDWLLSTKELAGTSSTSVNGEEILLENFRIYTLGNEIYLDWIHSGLQYFQTFKLITHNREKAMFYDLTGGYPNAITFNKKGNKAVDLVISGIQDEEMKTELSKSYLVKEGTATRRLKK